MLLLLGCVGVPVVAVRVSTNPFLSKSPFTVVAPESATKDVDTDMDEAPPLGSSSKAPTGTYLDTTISSSYILEKSFTASFEATATATAAPGAPTLTDSIDADIPGGSGLPEDRISELTAAGSCATGCFLFFLWRPDDMSLPDSKSAASCFSRELSKT